MSSETDFVYIEGKRFYVSKNKPQVGDLFIYTTCDNPYGYFATCIDRTSTHIIRGCSCGKCASDDMYIPIDKCRKLSLALVEFN